MDMVKSAGQFVRVGRIWKRGYGFFLLAQTQLCISVWTLSAGVHTSIQSMYMLRGRVLSTYNILFIYVRHDVLEREFGRSKSNFVCVCKCVYVGL